MVVLQAMKKPPNILEELKNGLSRPFFFKLTRKVFMSYNVKSIDSMTHCIDSVTHKTNLVTHNTDRVAHKTNCVTHTIDCMTYNIDSMTHNINRMTNTF